MPRSVKVVVAAVALAAAAAAAVALLSQRPTFTTDPNWQVLGPAPGSPAIGPDPLAVGAEFTIGRARLRIPETQAARFSTVAITDVEADFETTSIRTLGWGASPFSPSFMGFEKAWPPTTLPKFIEYSASPIEIPLTGDPIDILVGYRLQGNASGVFRRPTVVVDYTIGGRRYRRDLSVEVQFCNLERDACPDF